MNERQKKELLKLGCLMVAAFFAPVWIPVAVLTIIPVGLILAGILTTIALCVFSFLTVIFGVFGLPLLFSLAAIGSAYLMYKVFVKILAKARCFLKRFLCALNITVKIQKLMKGLPIIGRFVAHQETSKDDYLCQQPLYEEESETEAAVFRTKRPSVHFPFPRASLPTVEVSDNGDEIEVFFNNVEELYTVICTLRRSARKRASVSRRAGPRRSTLA